MECSVINFNGELLNMPNSTFASPVVVIVPVGASVNFEGSKFNEGLLVLGKDGDKLGVAHILSSKVANDSFSFALSKTQNINSYLFINIKNIDISVKDKSDPLWGSFSPGDLYSLPTPNQEGEE